MLSTDILDLKLDPATGDLALGADGGLQFATGIDGVAQLVKIRLLLFKEEWFLNLDAGIPYYEEILGEKFSDTVLRRRLAEAITSTPGVVEIVTLGIDFDASTRVISVTWAIRCQFGDTEPDTLAIGGTDA